MGCATESRISVAHLPGHAPQKCKILWRTPPAVRHRNLEPPLTCGPAPRCRFIPNFSNFPRARVDDVLPHPGLPRSTTTARRRQPAATAATGGVAGSPTPPPPSEETSTGGAARARALPLRPRSDDRPSQPPPEDLDTGLDAVPCAGLSPPSSLLSPCHLPPPPSSLPNYAL